jgi:Trypsin-co-occurring domain 1
MTKQAIAEFTLNDGTKIYVEVPEPSSGDAVEEAALGEEVYKVVDGAAGTFEKALDKVQPVANAVIERLVSGLTTPADEVEVKFGFKLTADAGVLICAVGGEASFEVTLKWGK